jgi:ribosomal protein S18 acetylase RimI-like enzyme
MRYRRADERDVDSIARLHADSWRRHYRGALSDEFLDGPVFAERRAVWEERLGQRQTAHRTIVADADGAVVGIAHVILGEHAQLGALLDNLHVAYDLKRGGIGTRLMSEAARVVLDETPGEGMYLEVLEQNVAAQEFYAARRGRRLEREVFPAPDGGTTVGFKYVWPDPAVLLVD